MKLKINQQEIQVAGDEIRLFIKEPFWTAGRQYDFNPQIGFGINVGIINYAQDTKRKIVIYLNFEGKVYKQTYLPEEIIEFVNRYNSIERRGEVNLFIVQWKKNGSQLVEWDF